MKSIPEIEFGNRQMKVRVFDYCEYCKTLREDVKPRESSRYWPKYFLKITSCVPCYEVARQAAIDEAKA